MTTTYKLGAGSSGGAYIKYLLSKAVDADHKLDAAARYYAGREAEQHNELSRVDELGRMLHHGDDQLRRGLFRTRPRWDAGGPRDCHG